MKTILLTFDYELFFKDSGTPEKSLLEPTGRLIEFFKMTGIHATFFIDILYYIRMLNENGTTRQIAGKIRQQLEELVRNGHRIELHLHPHWLDALYQNGKWAFPTYNRYRLHSLPKDQITELFITGAKELNKIASAVQPDYHVLSFRAGGWCIQPFKDLREGLAKAGIKIDSSVVPGMSGESEAHYLDFTDANRLDYYRFSDDPLEEASGGDFLEVPITSYKRKTFFKLWLFLERLLNKKQLKSCGDGVGICLDKEGILDKLKADESYLSLEKIRPETLIRLIDKSPHTLINLLTHQKNMSESSYKCLERLHQNSFYRFMTIAEFYESLKNQQI